MFIVELSGDAARQWGRIIHLAHILPLSPRNAMRIFEETPNNEDLETFKWKYMYIYGLAYAEERCCCFRAFLVNNSF